jgi:hypothetical protein
MELSECYVLALLDLAFGLLDERTLFRREYVVGIEPELAVL